ncbi:Similar to slc5a8: Sodium-coupled monocarboxylate transporter 1 (Danio rerio) [Cotesia congregata]|uniref:Similar to slc5a8: Sodium-coupled monocarboxylate transporter 1 (Danio rerio) n=1 Tax=Cotesia congregata TaxID=51543 RepID=A0A8J2HMU2_COTCN|nr:Similar to slc5a8: Sodium-coupled monocarboxylate transporter 1 (Danio rerio) [Cotesia congregata]
MDEKRTFDLIDCVVFALMLGVSAFVGVYHAYKARSNPDAVREYLIGGQKMSIFPISMSLIASYISGIALLGLPAEMYVYGTQYWSVIIADAFVSLTMAIIYLPVFYGLQITSSYEYLELRFNNYVRLLGSIIFIIKMLLYIPLVIYVPALAFNQVTGINVHVVAPLVCAVCIFYTTLGGLKAVVWTDTIQTVVMFGGVIIVAVLGTIRVGGFAEVWRRNFITGRIEFFNTIMIMAVGIITIVSLSCYTGILIYAAFYDCDPVVTKQINKADQLLPFYVMEIAQSIPGLPGLFVSGVFSAALSTMSTGLNSMSGVIYEDMIKPLMKKPLSQVAASRVMKFMVIFIGIICVALAGKSLSGITAGPLLGIFTLGMFFPCANSTGALVGALVSLHFVAWISLGTQAALSNGIIKIPKKPVSVEGCSEILQATAANATLIKDTINTTPFFLYQMSYLWYTWIGFLTAIIIGLFVSWLTGFNKYKSEDKKLYTPVIHCLLPSRSKKTNAINLEATSGS